LTLIPQPRTLNPTVISTGGKGGIAQRGSSEPDARAGHGRHVPPRARAAA